MPLDTSQFTILDWAMNTYFQDQQIGSTLTGWLRDVPKDDSNFQIPRMVLVQMITEHMMYCTVDNYVDFFPSLNTPSSTLERLSVPCPKDSKSQENQTYRSDMCWSKSQPNGQRTAVDEARAFLQEIGAHQHLLTWRDHVGPLLRLPWQEVPLAKQSQASGAALEHAILAFLAGTQTDPTGCVVSCTSTSLRRTKSMFRTLEEWRRQLLEETSAASDAFSTAIRELLSLVCAEGQLHSA